MDIHCHVCQKSIPAINYESHTMGKKHSERQAMLVQKRNIEETGLFIRGLPLGASAAEVGAAFGSYGPIAKVEIYGDTAYLNYVDPSSRDKALKFNHIIRHKVLEVDGRKIKPEPPNIPSQNIRFAYGRPVKRHHDDSFNKFSTKIGNKEESAGPPKPTKRGEGGPLQTKKMLDINAVLTALVKSSTILEQISKLKELVLAGDEYCNDLQHKICNDLTDALKTAFKVCELYAFGSTTTGLAFKTSDLDVYALLEFNPTTHQVDSDFKKRFATAKKCLYRRQKDFTNIVPIPKAKIPIIKVFHHSTQTSCDLSFSDAIGYCNSRLLRHYLNMNERFFDLIFFIKYWATVHKFNSPQGLSNFSLCMLGVSFLMSLKDSKGKKLLPSVQDLMRNADPSSPLFCIQGWKCGFDETPITVTLPDTTEFSLIGLIKNFFEYIANLQFETHVISVLTGELISRQPFYQNPSDLPDAYECYKSHIALHPGDDLCKVGQFAVIHDPFRLNHNLLGRTSTTDMHKFIFACETAKNKCEEAMNDTGKECLLLSHLLSVNKVKTDQKTKNQRRSKEKTLSITMERPFSNNTQDLEKIKDLLCGIFNRLLFLKTAISEETSLGESKPKVCRVEGMEDVLDNSPQSAENHFLLTCEGQKNVWDGRRKAKAWINVSNPITFQDEESISKYLSEKNSTVHFQFKCKVMLVGQHLLMEFIDFSVTNDVSFNCFFSFVDQHFPRWIRHFSKA